MRKSRSTRFRANYEVGKGKPPKSTQWKPGQSGNPTGRPKGAKNLLIIFHQALEQKVQIDEKGRTRTITVREGIVRRIVHQALKGDIKAIAFVLAKEPEIARQVMPREKIPANATAEEIAKIYFRRIKQVT